MKFRPAQVTIGSYFSKTGGVSQHIHNVKQYSKFHLDTLPNLKSLNLIQHYKLIDFYKQAVENSVNGFRIIHSHVDPWFIALSQKAQLNGAKWVHTYHTLYFEKDWEQGLQPWQIDTNKALIEVAKEADTKIAVSRWLQIILKEKYHIETIYIPNGVDVAKCNLADKSRFIDKHHYKDFILFAGGIDDIKNPLDFLKLADALPDKTFVMAGKGLSVANLKAKNIKAIPNNVVVLGEMMHNDLLDAIAACKVFVVTSRSEGLPTVLMEAMALERSVVGCNTYGTKEVIHSEEYGYIYKHDSIEDLINKTQMAFKVSKGEKARQRILEHYDWKVIAPQIDEVYKNCIND